MYLEKQLTQIFTFTGTCLHYTSGKTEYLKNLVYRAYIVWSDNQHLEYKLNYLTKVFQNFNSYPHCSITKVVNEVNKDTAHRNN